MHSSTSTPTPASQPPLAAPSPATPRRSKRWAWFGGFALLLVAVPIAYYYITAWLHDREMGEIYRALDEEDPNWRWHDLAAEIKPPPDADNSALHIREIHVLLKATPFDTGPAWTDIKFRNARLTDSQERILRAAFAKVNPKAVPMARALKDKPRGTLAFEPVESPFLDIKLDYVQETRTLMNFLHYDALLRIHDNDPAGAIDSCRALVHASRSLREQPFLISLLVRYAGQAMTIAAIEQTLAQNGEFTEDMLRPLQEALEQEYADDGMHRAMRGERAGGQQMYEQLRSGRTAISQLTTAMGAKAGFADHVIDFVPSVVLNSYPDHLKDMNEQVRASKLQDPERAAALRELEAQIRQRRTLLSMFLMPATFKVSEASQRTQANLRSCTTALAVERHRLKHGQWPRDLNELVAAGLLKDVPKDPYDGKPLRLKKTPTGVIVYTLGPDKVDNGGALNRAAPLAPNTDYGFELWDPRFRGVPPPAGNDK